jgi:hypothetical protein
VIELVIAAVVGSSCALITNRWLNRDTASREAREQTYSELLKMLERALRVWEPATGDPDVEVPDVIGDDEIDEFNARLRIDASPAVRDLTERAFAIAQRFNVSLAMRVPVDVDEHGLFLHRFDKVRGSEEGAILVRRWALNEYRDEFRAAVDDVATQIRRELRGRRA